MKLLSILSLVGCATFLIDHTGAHAGQSEFTRALLLLVVRPLYLLAVAAVALVIGWLALANPVP